MALSIGILGLLVIERDDCRLGKVPKKARALLGYLAAQGGQAVSRERLADLLWPYQKLDGFDLALTGFGELELGELRAERTEGPDGPRRCAVGA